MSVSPDYHSIPAPLVFTDAAAAKVRELVGEEGNPNLKLRVYITGGGIGEDERGGDGVVIG